MAPEMLLGKPDYDELVDARSLGCVMAELLAGERLLPGHRATHQLLRISRVLGVHAARRRRTDAVDPPRSQPTARAVPGGAPVARRLRALSVLYASPASVCRLSWRSNAPGSLAPPTFWFLLRRIRALPH
ncbi:hypothetical protein ZWY2020_001531 [Hordeum vulgare]|nr:hypothetical protein ZWY2020_001531 [Hordeum vulgare]